MTTSNGADNIQLLNLKYSNKELELENNVAIFRSKSTAIEMLNAKGDVDRVMLELIDIQAQIEYIERGWEPWEVEI